MTASSHPDASNAGLIARLQEDCFMARCGWPVCAPCAPDEDCAPCQAAVALKAADSRERALRELCEAKKQRHREGWRDIEGSTIIAYPVLEVKEVERILDDGKGG